MVSGPPGMVGDPHLRLGLLALLLCVLLMANEFASTCVWLPRQTGRLVDWSSSPAATKSDTLDHTAASVPPTLSGAVRAAASERAVPQAESAALLGGPAAAHSDGQTLAALAADPPMAAWQQVAVWMAGMIAVRPAAVKEDEGPRYPLREEYEWLERCRLPSGALVMAPGDSRINPYFANLAAMALLHWSPDAVRDWILWYIGHINETDRFGLRGTVYDHQLVAGRELPEGDYDSADSYAATFLTLVARYFFTTGDAALVLTHLDKLETVAGVCLALLDKDDLTWAKADRRYKFLMDNTEVYRGLSDWAEVLRTLGFWRQGDAWAGLAERVRAAVDRELWIESRGAYSWAKTSLGTRAIRRRWYPDTAAQLYPILHGLIDPDGPRAQSLIAMVNNTFPGWPHLATGDEFPWALTAFVNAVAGDRDMAMSFLDSVWDRHLSAGRPWPWYNMEAAYLVFTVLELTHPGSVMPSRR